MFTGYRNLKISKKLLLSNLAFALPVVVLIFFMNISFTYDINIGRTELAGTHYLGKLFLLLEQIPTYFGAAESQKEVVSKKIQDIFDDLEKMPPEITSALAPKADTLAKPANGYLSIKSLHDQWRSISSSPATIAGQEKFLHNIQELISLTGRNYKLVLDPALDSNILASIIVSLLPAHCNTLTRLFYELNPGRSDKAEMLTAANLLSENLSKDLTLFRASSLKIIIAGKRVLAADTDFYGYSASLQQKFGSALEKYQQAVEKFNALTEKINEQPISLTAYLSAGRKVQQECRQLLLIGLAELDILIEKRIASYQHWQFLGFSYSALALLLASFFIFFISKSITRPVRAIINYTRKISAGDYKASLTGDFQAEFKTLANDLKGMVHKIVDLAAFPQENPAPILAANMFGSILYTNSATQKVLKNLNLDIQEFLPPNHKEIVAACLAGCRDCSDTESKAGKAVFSWNYYPLADQGIVHIYARDITLQKQLAQQLQHDAFHDGLTNLPNRALFIDRLQQVLKKHSLHPAEYAVFSLDLDRFKLVNDSLGHETGDQLLIAVGKRVNELTEADVTLARLGGDEFALLLENITIHKAVATAQRILHDLKKPFHIGTYELSVTSSIGIVTGNNSAIKAAEDILRDADTAMYRAKAIGGNGYVVFEDKMHEKALARLEMEVALKKGIDRNEFMVYYQPIVDLRNPKIAGFEALVRWQHPEQGLLPPGVFIPLAEETGLIVPLGKKVLRTACRQARLWQQEINGYEELMISVNLAVPQLTAGDLMEDIDSILLESGLPAHTLKLEVTESGLMGNVEASLAVLTKIKQRFISLGIDDFGTGYSSLSYLHQFPFDTLKVDRSFVIEMEKDAKNMAIIKTIIALAHGLQKKVITEGIETKEQLEQIRQLGCEYGQGNFFAKPLPAHEAEEFLKDFNRHPFCSSQAVPAQRLA